MRRAAKNYRADAIATQWRISPLAVISAANILGMYSVGKIIIAPESVINGKEFYAECRVQNEMLIAALRRKFNEEINRHSPGAKASCSTKADCIASRAGQKKCES